MAQIKDLHTLCPLKRGSKALSDHTFVPVHMCFGVKFDLSIMSLLVAEGGALQDPGIRTLTMGWSILPCQDSFLPWTAQ